METVTTLEEYISYLDNLTTQEFCTIHTIPTPRFTGDVTTAATAFLQIDAIKYRLINEYNKTLKKKALCVT